MHIVRTIKYSFILFTDRIQRLYVNSIKMPNVCIDKTDLAKIDVIKYLYMFSDTQ